MGSIGEENSVLTDLGLTLTQAKAYLALWQSGNSSAKTISTESGIARQDVYRILIELQELGLIEKALANPAVFQPMPLQEAIEILMERRAKKTRELQVETQSLLQNFRENDKRTKLTVEEPQFVLVPKGRAYVLKGKMAIRTAQESIECITSWKRFLRMMFVVGGDIMEALNRGARCRFILDKPEDKKPLPEIVDNLFKNPSCKVRYILALPGALFARFDKKEVLISTSTNGPFLESSMLWSDDPPLLSMTQDYFEILWIRALENPLKM